ncbi:MAG: hypothetical protein AB8G17_14780 [Gammaproteobacteria bacterium]
MMTSRRHWYRSLALPLLLGASTAWAWEQVPDTRLDQVNPCPSDECEYSGNMGFRAVVEAWNGAAFDQAGNRMLVYGGGHTDYWGNEVYQLDVTTWRWSRLSEPAALGDKFRDIEAERTGRLPDGSPRVPHTYDSLVYEPTLDALLAIGAPGTSPKSIGGHSHIERFDLTDGRWLEPLAKVSLHGYWLGGTARDPDSGLIWVHTSSSGQLAAYDPRRDKWKTGRRKALFKNFTVAAGGGQLLMLGGCGNGRCNHWVQDLSKPNESPRDLPDLAPIARVQSPGLAYDSQRGVFAAYVDGVLYHIDTQSGQYERVAAGPPSTKLGVYGRFAYAESLDAYVYVAATDQDVWVHRMSESAPIDDPSAQ